MNIALPALIVFAILLPGFIVRSRFKRAERASLDYSPFGQVVTEAVLWAIVLHAAWLASAAALGHPFRPDVLMKLMSADGGSQAGAIDAAAGDANRVALYFGSLLMFAYVAPAVARKAITRLRLDRADAKLSWLLRFHRAPWYYLLTGADFTAEEEPDLIVVSAVVQVADQPVLYTGILEDFYLDHDGNLDRLVLQGVMRRSFANDKEAGEASGRFSDRFYAVDGDYFVLRYSEAITLNIEYVKLRPDDTETHSRPLEVSPTSTGREQDEPES